MSLSKLLTRSVVTAEPKTSVQDAAKQMRDLHVGDVVVVEKRDEKTVPIGILTDRDIVVSTTAFGLAPDSVSIEDVMTPAPTCARTSDNIWDALIKMKERGVKRLPVLSETGTLAGIISVDDIVGLLGTELSEISTLQKRQRAVETERRRKLA